jgi:Protein of unknown function (DUF3611)
MTSTQENILEVPGNRQAVGNDSLARAFRRLGWIGFWAQVTIGAIPIALTVYAFISNRAPTTGTRGVFPLIEYLAIVSLLMLAFTTLWSYGYTRLAKKIADSEFRLPQSEARRSAWTGVVASTVSILFSILVILFEVAQLFFYFLRAPQAGIPVVQTTAGGPTSWVSASDIMSLLALNVSLLVELFVLAFSLWLLFRSTLATTEASYVSNAE